VVEKSPPASFIPQYLLFGYFPALSNLYTFHHPVLGHLVGLVSELLFLLFFFRTLFQYNGSLVFFFSYSSDKLYIPAASKNLNSNSVPNFFIKYFPRTSWPLLTFWWCLFVRAYVSALYAIISLK
jgi:hypothetical protein